MSIRCRFRKGCRPEDLRAGGLVTRIMCTRNDGTVNVTLSVDDEVMRQARRHAEALGTSVNQLVREYLEQLAGRTDPAVDAEEFRRLSHLAQGDSANWRINREELHERG